MKLEKLDWPANPNKPGLIGLDIRNNNICDPDSTTSLWLNKHARSGWINTQTCGN